MLPDLSGMYGIFCIPCTKEKEDYFNIVYVSLYLVVWLEHIYLVWADYWKVLYNTE